MTNAQSKINPYAHAVIYVIISPNCDLFYYGSTINTLEKRFAVHKGKKSTCTSRQIIEAGGAKIYEIESYPCTCLSELEDREAWWILNDWDGCVNENVPGAVRRAGGLTAYMKAYNAKPEQIAYYKAYHKAYNAKPEIKARKKAYDASPEQKAYKSEKIMCDICGCMSSRRNISTHQKSQKCQKVLHGVQ